MLKVPVLIFIMVGTVFAGFGVAAIVTVPALAEAGVKLPAIAAAIGLGLAVAVSVAVEKATGSRHGSA